MLEYYSDGANILCHAVKDGDCDAIIQMAQEIVFMENIPEGSVLIPAPQHTGRAEYTLILAQEIACLTNSIVFDILRCKPHESQYVLKQKGIDVSFDFYLSGPKPKGMNVFFVDNVISSGKTFATARKILGKHLRPLVYAVDSTRLKKRYHVFDKTPFSR